MVPGTFLHRINFSRVKIRTECKKFFYKVKNVKSWYCDNNYKFAKVTVFAKRSTCLAGFWIYQASEYVSSSKYTRVKQGSEQVCICLDNSFYAWLSDYARKCVNIPESAWVAFVLYVPIVIPCLLECTVAYFSEVYSLKEHETISLLRGKIWFFLE